MLWWCIKIRVCEWIGPIRCYSTGAMQCVGYRLQRTKQEEKTEQPPTKGSPEYAPWRIRAPDLFTLYETHSSGGTRREKSLLLAPPVRILVVSSVVSDWLPTTPAGVDRVDFIVVSVVADI